MAVPHELRDERLALLRLPHYDRDHYGGIDEIVALGVTVGTWYERGERQHLPASKTNQPEYQQYVATTQMPVALAPGDRIDLDPTVTITVVAVNGHVRGAVGRYGIDALDENGYSVALLISWEGFNYFIGGDLTEEVEGRLVLEAALGDIEVYKVNHHGSDTSSRLDFLHLIRPEVAIISNGSFSCFNHPRTSVLDNLRQIPGIEIYQTNRLKDEHFDQCNSGAIVGSNVAEANIADPETDEADGHISIVVADGNYVVSLPARGTSRTFPIN